MQWVSKQTQRVRFFFSFCFIFTKFTSDPYSPPSQLAPSSHSPGPAAALTQLGTPPLLRLCSQGCTLTVSPLDSLSMSFVTPAHDGGLFSGCPLLWGLHSGVEFDLCEEHTQVCLPSFWPQLSAVYSEVQTYGTKTSLSLLLAPGERGTHRDITLVCNVFILYLEKIRDGFHEC